MALRPLDPKAANATEIQMRVAELFTQLGRTCGATDECKQTLSDRSYYLLDRDRVLKKAAEDVVTLAPRVGAIYIPNRCFPPAAERGSRTGICTNVHDRFFQVKGDDDLHRFSVDLSLPGLRVLLGDVDRNGTIDIVFQSGNSTKIFLADATLAKPLDEEIELFPGRTLQRLARDERPRKISFLPEDTLQPVYPPLTYEVAGNYGAQKGKLEAALRDAWDVVKTNFPSDGRPNPFRPHHTKTVNLNPVVVIDTANAIQTRLANAAATYGAERLLTWGYITSFAGIDLLAVDSPQQAMDIGYVQNVQRIASTIIAIDADDVDHPYFRENLLFQVAERMGFVVPQYLVGQYSLTDVATVNTNHDAVLYIRELIRRGKIPPDKYNLAYLQSLPFPSP